MSPHMVVGWEDAMCMLFTQKVKILNEYDEIVTKLSVDKFSEFEHVLNDLSPSSFEDDHVVIRIPSVVILKKPVKTIKYSIRFCRMNVFIRDKFTCQYCDKKFHIKDLNYDHFIPSVRGGSTTWENIVTSCYPCNTTKDNVMPNRDGTIIINRDGETRVMRLKRRPFKPKFLPIHTYHFDTSSIPKIWEEYYDIPEEIAERN